MSPPSPPPPITNNGGQLACVASVSVRFRSKERPRKGIFGFDREGNETRAKKWKRGRGRGRGRKETLADKPLDSENLCERSAWLARLVEQSWHVSIKGLFHTERSCMVRDTHINFLWLFFILVGKICPPNARAFSLTSFVTQSSSCD